MTFRTDAVVIGAGVVGLAVARALARSGLETLILERGDRIGAETSSRNSEVIHAGIHYPPDSLKAETCVEGKALLYAYLNSHGVPYRRCGKLIVGSGGEAPRALEAIRRRAAACGVDDLELLTGAEAADLEPAVRGDSALLSPSSGIVDSHQLMLSLLGEVEAAGGSLALNSPLQSGALARSGPHRLRTGGAGPATLECGILVNAAGLYAGEVWRRLGAPGAAPAQYLAKGHYYSYSAPAPFARLVYPLPAESGLGVHATLDLGGRIRFGPDVRWVERVDYSFDDSGRARFEASIRDYFPALDASRLQPGYTGIRPRLAGRGQPAADFLLLAEPEHGVPGFCSLHGIESPGLTACLAIAGRVVERLKV
jgi:L-2-hydroxyglutarate oxidase LhgO